jgi:hypothetical protein
MESRRGVTSILAAVKVTIRQAMADELQLEIYPTLQHISGYAGGATLANGVSRDAYC